MEQQLSTKPAHYKGSSHHSTDSNSATSIGSENGYNNKTNFQPSNHDATWMLAMMNFITREKETDSSIIPPMELPTQPSKISGSFMPPQYIVDQLAALDTMSKLMNFNQQNHPNQSTNIIPNVYATKKKRKLNVESMELELNDEIDDNIDHNPAEIPMPWWPMSMPFAQAQPLPTLGKNGFDKTTFQTPFPAFDPSLLPFPFFSPEQTMGALGANKFLPPPLFFPPSSMKVTENQERLITPDPNPLPQLKINKNVSSEGGGIFKSPSKSLARCMAPKPTISSASSSQSHCIDQILSSNVVPTQNPPKPAAKKGGGERHRLDQVIAEIRKKTLGAASKMEPQTKASIAVTASKDCESVVEKEMQPNVTQVNQQEPSSNIVPVRKRGRPPGACNKNPRKGKDTRGNDANSSGKRHIPNHSDLLNMHTGDLHIDNNMENMLKYLPFMPPPPPQFLLPTHPPGPQDQKMLELLAKAYGSNFLAPSYPGPFPPLPPHPLSFTRLNGDMKGSREELDEMNIMAHDEKRRTSVIHSTTTNSNYHSISDRKECCSRQSPSHSNAYHHHKRRKLTDIDEASIRKPLEPEHGWERRTLLKGMAASGPRGEVTYITPCGKRLRSYPEVERYIERRNLGGSLSPRLNFSFSSKIVVGKFFRYDSIEGTESQKLIHYTEKEINDMVNETRAQRAPCSQAIIGSAHHKDNGMNGDNNSTTFDIKCSNHLWEGNCQASKVETITSNQNKFVDNSERCDELSRRDISKINTKPNAPEQPSPFTFPHFDGLDLDPDTLKTLYASKNLRENSHKRAHPSFNATNPNSLPGSSSNGWPSMQLPFSLPNIPYNAMLPSHHNQLTMATSQFGNMPPRFKGKFGESKMARRRFEMLMAKEMKKPQEDISLLSESKALPDFPLVPGVKLDMNSFAQLIMILEFVHNFSESLEIVFKNGQPTIYSLQAALTNENDKSSEDITNIGVALLSKIFIDPDLITSINPLNCQFNETFLMMGKHVTDTEIDSNNFSEFLRLYVDSHHGRGAPEVSDQLQTNPFESLKAAHKIDILSFLCDKLLEGNMVINKIEQESEVIAGVKKEKWANEGEIRKLRFMNEQESLLSDDHCDTLKQPLQLKDEVCESVKDREMINGSSILKESTKIMENYDLNGDSSALNVSGGASNETLAKAEHPENNDENGIKNVKDEKMTDPSEEGHLNKLLQMQKEYRQKLFALNSKTRASCLGQDRYRRRYWVLPGIGGFFIEGINPTHEGNYNLSSDKEFDILATTQPQRSNELVVESKPDPPPLNSTLEANGNSSKISFIPEEVVAKQKAMLVMMNMLTPMIKNQANLAEIIRANAEILGKAGIKIDPDIDINKDSFNVHKFIDGIASSMAQPSTNVSPNGSDKPDKNQCPDNKLSTEPNHKSQADLEGNRYMGKWWYIRDMDQLKELATCLNERGIREKNLLKNLNKYLSIFDAIPSFVENQRPDEVIKKDMIFDSIKDPSPKFNTDSTIAIDLKALEAVERLECKIHNANMQNKFWRLPTRLSQDPLINWTKQSMEIHKCEVGSDDCSFDALYIASQRLAALELAIERRYLKQPLGKGVKEKFDGDAVKRWFTNQCNILNLESIKDAQHTCKTPPQIQAFGQSSHKICVKSDNESALEGLPLEITESSIPTSLQDEKVPEPQLLISNNLELSLPENLVEIPPALVKWRLAVTNIKNASQLHLCITFLKNSIAWDKSIMKVFCQLCLYGHNEDKLLLCDGCDKGYHMYCLKPIMEKVPEGDWFCYQCISKATCEPLCSVCGQKGKKLSKCDKCSRLFHPECFETTTPQKANKSSRWKCPACRGQIKGWTEDFYPSSISPPPGEEIPLSPQPLSDSKHLAPMSSSVGDENSEPSIKTLTNNDNTYDETGGLVKSESSGKENPCKKRKRKGFILPVKNCASNKSSKRSRRTNSANTPQPKESSPALRFSDLDEYTFSDAPSDRNKDSSCFKNQNVEAEGDIVNGSNGDDLKSLNKDDRNIFDILLTPIASKEESIVAHAESTVLGGFSVFDVIKCRNILADLKSHKESWPFLQPVNTRAFPQYKKIIKNPMDLHTLEMRLNQNIYNSNGDFLKDIKLIFDNCELFNEDDSTVGKAGHELRKYFLNITSHSYNVLTTQ